MSSALGREGRQWPVVVVREERGVLPFSDDTFDELPTRRRLPKFDRYGSPEVRAICLAQLEAVSEGVPIADAKLGCRNPDDDKPLETALTGASGCLVTWDRDLLAPCLRSRTVRYCHRRAFLIFGQSDNSGCNPYGSAFRYSAAARSSLTLSSMGDATGP